MATRVMGDAVSCIILLLFQTYDLNSAEKISEYYVLEYLREHRVYFVVYSMPNYGGDYYRSLAQKVERVLQMSYCLKLKAYLCFVVCVICLCLYMLLYVYICFFKRVFLKSLPFQGKLLFDFF